MHSVSSKSRPNRRALALFPLESLFDRLARAVCEDECLPRKELYDAWEWRGGCAGTCEAGAWSTSPRVTGCSPT